MSEVVADIYDAPTANLAANVAAPPDKLFSHRGRLGILRYNARSMLVALVMLVPLAMIVVAFKAWLGEQPYSIEGNMAVPLGAAGAILMIPCSVASTFLLIKRMHDSNFTGWLLLPGILVPLLGSIWMLYVAVKPGNSDVNRYGPPPQDELKIWEKVAGIGGITLFIAITIWSIGPILMAGLYYLKEAKI